MARQRNTKGGKRTVNIKMPCHSENLNPAGAKHFRFFLYFDMLKALLKDNRDKAKAGQWAIVVMKDDCSTYLINLREHPENSTVGFYDCDAEEGEWTDKYGWAWRDLDTADFIYVLPEKDIDQYKIARLFDYVELAEEGLDIS